MTDADLNRAVAEARGLTHCNCGDPECPYWVDQRGRNASIDLSLPAAWGALFEELAAEGSVSLSYIEERGQWFATVTREPAIYSGWDAEQPGRALAMAFLGSKEL